MMKASSLFTAGNGFLSSHKPLLVCQGYTWHIRNGEAVADGQAPSPCPLALFVSQSGEAKHHYLLSGLFSQGVQPGLYSEREIKRVKENMGRVRDGKRRSRRACHPPVLQVISWSGARALLPLETVVFKAVMLHKAAIYSGIKGT